MHTYCMNHQEEIYFPSSKDKICAHLYASFVVNSCFRFKTETEINVIKVSQAIKMKQKAY